METSSEETQEQRRDKRATNESSQRARSAVFIGAATYSCHFICLHTRARNELLLSSQKSHVFACRKLLMVQMWTLPSPGFIATRILWFKSFFPFMLCVIEVYRLQDVSADWAPAAGGKGGMVHRPRSPL